MRTEYKNALDRASDASSSFDAIKFVLTRYLLIQTSSAPGVNVELSHKDRRELATKLKLLRRRYQLSNSYDFTVQIVRNNRVYNLSLDWLFNYYKGTQFTQRSYLESLALLWVVAEKYQF